ncbi:MAG: Crp/Fnr family transcriptional regulator [Synergistales bacterium]|nr:Crp/Fnr family transcriptional regulator [Synergistales bacterium]
MRCGVEGLAMLPGFSVLPGEQVCRIAEIAVPRRFRRGERIFSEGDEGEGFYVVLEGKVKVFRLSSEGKEVILHFCHRGDNFGQVAMYAGNDYPADAEALSDTRLLFFERESFIQHIKEEPTLALGMLAALSVRLREFTQQVENLALKEVPARIATYILYLAEKQQNWSRVQMDSTQNQLSRMIGTTPETLSRLMTRLEETGVIAVSRSTIAIRDWRRLQSLSERGFAAIEGDAAV